MTFDVSELVSDKLENLPDKPGVYLMKDIKGEVIYVGKAIVLKNRVRSYFRDFKRHVPRIRSMVTKIADIDWIITGTEKEALVLECNLIKRYRPYFNVSMKDDKSYPYLKVSIQERFSKVVYDKAFCLEMVRNIMDHTRVQVT